MQRKTVVVIGSILVAGILVSLVAVALITTFQGESAVPFKPAPGGRGGVLFPVTLLPLGVAGIVVVVLWVRRRLLRGRRRVSEKTPNPALQGTPLKRRP